MFTDEFLCAYFTQINVYLFVILVMSITLTRIHKHCWSANWLLLLFAVFSNFIRLCVMWKFEISLSLSPSTCTLSSSSFFRASSAFSPLSSSTDFFFGCFISSSIKTLDEWIILIPRRSVWIGIDEKYQKKERAHWMLMRWWIKKKKKKGESQASLWEGLEFMERKYL